MIMHIGCSFKDETMMPQNFENSTASRKGRFLWMDEHSQKQYLAQLKRRISTGYFKSEKIIASIVEEIAPAINDTIDQDLSLHY
jgi:hypothetical protein